jgi:hypothetical protein
MLHQQICATDSDSHTERVLVGVESLAAAAAYCNLAAEVFGWEGRRAQEEAC